MNTPLSRPRAAAGDACVPHRIAEFARYFVASAGALCVDVGLYQLGLHAGLAYQWAALIGFSAGAVVAYIASIAWVFEARTINRSALEFGFFVAIGVAGLLLTELLLWVQIDHLGWPKFLSKAGSAGVVFFFNFGMRKTLLFGTRRAQATTVPAVDALAGGS